MDFHDYHRNAEESCFIFAKNPCDGIGSTPVYSISSWYDFTHNEMEFIEDPGTELNFENVESFPIQFPYLKPEDKQYTFQFVYNPESLEQNVGLISKTENGLSISPIINLSFKYWLYAGFQNPLRKSPDPIWKVYYFGKITVTQNQATTE